MALNKANLSSAMAATFASYPASADAAALALAADYDAYAKLGQSCAGLTPTAVNLVGLENGLKAAFAGGSYADVADAFGDALVAYWTGALFGPTGTVTVIGGTAALKSGLEALWQAQSITLATFPDSADLHADLLDVFTKAVTVTDSAIPCGPAPIV